MNHSFSRCSRAVVFWSHLKKTGVINKFIFPRNQTRSCTEPAQTRHKGRAELAALSSFAAEPTRFLFLGGWWRRSQTNVACSSANSVFCTAHRTIQASVFVLQKALRRPKLHVTCTSSSRFNVQTTLIHQQASLSRIMSNNRIMIWRKHSFTTVSLNTDRDASINTLKLSLVFGCFCLLTGRLFWGRLFATFLICFLLMCICVCARVCVCVCVCVCSHEAMRVWGYGGGVCVCVCVVAWFGLVKGGGWVE